MPLPAIFLPSFSPVKSARFLVPRHLMVPGRLHSDASLRSWMAVSSVCSTWVKALCRRLLQGASGSSSAMPGSQQSGVRACPEQRSARRPKGVRRHDWGVRLALDEAVQTQPAQVARHARPGLLAAPVAWTRSASWARVGVTPVAGLRRCSVRTTSHNICYVNSTSGSDD